MSSTMPSVKLSEYPKCIFYWSLLSASRLAKGIRLNIGFWSLIALLFYTLNNNISNGLFWGITGVLFGAYVIYTTIICLQSKPEEPDIPKVSKEEAKYLFFFFSNAVILSYLISFACHSSTSFAWILFGILSILYIVAMTIVVCNHTQKIKPEVAEKRWEYFVPVCVLLGGPTLVFSVGHFLFY